MKIVLAITLEYAFRNQWVSSDPTNGIKLPKKCCEVNLVERQVLSAQQITNLVSVLSEPYSTLVSFIAETGVRIGEAAGIRPENFDGDFIHIQRRIYNCEVGPLKTVKSHRWLPVSPELKQRMLVIAGEWVFCSRAGGPIDDGNSLRRYIYPACKRLHIKMSGWHDLRHTLSTTLRKRDVHPTVIRDIMGHTKVDLSMNTYGHTDREDLAAALRCDPIVTQNEKLSSPIFILKELVSAEGIEPSTY